ncbi:MAG: amidophosphoribosyltransferase [Deltaproteobacteria bacterium RBG_13_52_11]|nr:MAG: amidophosphoribosyltransferase [Deltaproteobacteria bacterium RBG_13_52_11]
MSCSWNEECGVFGVYGHPEAANLTYLGLYALQHRGQESAGIVSSNGRGIYTHKEMGLVSEIFDQDVLKKLPGRNAIGHVRYSTAGGSYLKNAQPFVFDYSKGGIAISHNGNLTNAQALRDQLEREGAVFQSTMDTEVIIHLFAHATNGSIVERVITALKEVKGAYSLLFLNEKELIAARDPHGFRPLVLGRVKEGYVVGSETCAFDLIGAEFIREIEPGEVLMINEAGIQSFRPFPTKKHRFCIFEFIYFARPDSYIFGHNVYQVRRELGVQLAKEHPVEADVVIPTPDSGMPAAIGFAHQSGIPLELGIIRNHYVGRTFIEPRESIRHFGVKIKLNAVKEAMKDKRVVVLDDSIVRGTTARKNMRMIKNSGATEVHVRISCPPISASCFYGIDTPTSEELIASSHSVEEIRRFIRVNSLGYLSLEGLKRCVAPRADEFCYACFTGEYPIDPPHDNAQLDFFIKEV